MKVNEIFNTINTESLFKIPTKPIKGRDVFERMAIAVAEYIESIGGTAFVVSGVSVGKEIGSAKYNYFIQIEVTGKMPLTPSKKKDEIF